MPEFPFLLMIDRRAAFPFIIDSYAARQGQSIKKRETHGRRNQVLAGQSIRI